MNLIFLTMSLFEDLEIHNIYADLLKEFIAQGHRPYLVTPVERQSGKSTKLMKRDQYVVLRVGIGNVSHVSSLEKGISTVLLEKQFIDAIRKYLSGVHFDLILYSTPPVTFSKVIKYLKQKERARTYLMLKDIFPQNAVDLGMIKKGSVIYKYFRKKEKALYSESDHIGCMSQANVLYLLNNNPELLPNKVTICPNSIIPNYIEYTNEDRLEQRKEYGIPDNRVVFIYGGNMGLPQDIPFVIQCLRKVSDRKDCFFVMCGVGSEYYLLENYANIERPSNVLLINGLEKAKYDLLVQICDVGLIFLDHRFTIPNFPSRILSYMEQSKPILACTDYHTDIGKVIVEGGFGWWCESDDANKFEEVVNCIIACKVRLNMGKVGRRYLEKHYSVVDQYKQIVQVFCDE